MQGECSNHSSRIRLVDILLKLITLYNEIKNIIILILYIIIKLIITLFLNTMSYVYIQKTCKIKTKHTSDQKESVEIPITYIISNLYNNLLNFTLH